MHFFLSIVVVVDIISTSLIYSLMTKGLKLSFWVTSYVWLATDLFVPEDDVRSVMAVTPQNPSLNLNQLLSLPHYERECLEELVVPYHYSESK